jgi:hypothetical protein
MALFAICLDPSLHAITKEIPGYRHGRTTTRNGVLAYADDVTVFLQTPADVSALKKILDTYMKATGAEINIRKSKAMAMNSWDTNINILDIPYVTEQDGAHGRRV